MNNLRYFTVKLNAVRIIIGISIILNALTLYLIFYQNKNLRQIKAESVKNEVLIHDLNNKLSELEDQIYSLDLDIEQLERSVDDLEGYSHYHTYSY
jgi:peptidoglycan hydrolase CwlO-like protein